MSYCSSPPHTRGFQIYEETGRTPTQAINNHRLPLHSIKQTTNDKENQFSAASAAANPQAEEEPMAVDFVCIMLLPMLWH